MVNYDVIVEWVAALRTDDYKQGNIFLKLGESYSAWGVVCELAVRHGIIAQSIQRPDKVFNIDVNQTWFYDRLKKAHYYEGEATHPPDIVINWLNIDPLTIIAQPHETISSLNEHVIFSEIASHIEKQWL